MIDLEKLQLKITYRNLFKFQNEYSNSKDLVEVVAKKNSVDQETMMQIIYVGYLGSEVDKKLAYEEFLDNINFDLARDSKIFARLINNSEKN